jgi:hypothetical protein
MPGKYADAPRAFYLPKLHFEHGLRRMLPQLDDSKHGDSRWLCSVCDFEGASHTDLSWHCGRCEVHLCEACFWDGESLTEEVVAAAMADIDVRVATFFAAPGASAHARLCLGIQQTLAKHGCVNYQQLCHSYDALCRDGKAGDLLAASNAKARSSTMHLASVDPTGQRGSLTHGLISRLGVLSFARIMKSSGSFSHAEYVLNVAAGENEWLVSKRFSQISNFHKRLRAVVKSLKREKKEFPVLPRFPGKSLLNSKDTFLERRTQKLREYVEALVALPELASRKAFVRVMNDFLKRDVMQT